MTTVRMRAIGCMLMLAATAGCTSNSDDEPKTEPTSIGATGDCYMESQVKPVECTLEHTAETVLVRRVVPTSTIAALTPCREAQAHYLGQDFNTRLDVQLWIASDRTWERCDVFVRNSTKAGSGYQTVTGSLRGVLQDGVPVAYQACLDEPFDAAGDQVYIPCDQPHVAQELIIAPAIGTNDEPFPDDVEDRASRVCNAAAASDKSLAKVDYKVSAFYPEDAAAWASGERSADCWVTAKDGMLPPATEVTSTGSSDHSGD